MAISTHEVDAARLTVIRGRLTVLWAVMGALVIVLALIPVAVAWGIQRQGLRGPAVFAAIVNVAMGCWLCVAPRVRAASFARMTLPRLIRRTTVVMLVSVFCQTLGAAILSVSLTVVLKRWGLIGEGAAVGPALPMIAYLALAHTAVSVVVPWTVWEAARPILIVLGMLLFADVFLFKGDSLNMQVLGVGLTALAGVPGILIAALRFGKLRDWVEIRSLSSRQEEMERELGVARRIHERLFPRAGDYGGVAIAYAYEPMRQIGGDYLHVQVDARGDTSVVVVDVTGHGIGSALAVNRLHGEIKRVGAAGASEPADLLRALNDYVGATLAEETVFATALAVRVSPNSRRVAWCNAGHPPAMVVRSGGSVDRLDTTAMMLGVMQWDTRELAAGGEAMLGTGDVLVIYTDGAIEAADASGKQFGIEGVERALREYAGSGAAAMVAGLRGAVQKHRAGAAEDDMLIVGIE